MRSRADVPTPRQRRDRDAGIVHVRHRDREHHLLAVDAHVVDQRAVLALAQPSAVPLRQDLDNVRARVVARLRVLVAGVAEPDHQQVGGHWIALALGRGLLAARGGCRAGFAFGRFALDRFALGGCGHFLGNTGLADLHDRLVGIDENHDAGRHGQVAHAQRVADLAAP